MALSPRGQRLSSPAALATRSLHSEQSANHELDCRCCGRKSWMGLGWLRMRRMRFFMLQRRKRWWKVSSQSSRINWQLKEGNPMCSSSLLRNCMDVGMVLKGSAMMCHKNLIRCEALPCFFLHEKLHILVELHQDDIHCTAPAESVMWLKEELMDEIRLKFSEIVYPCIRYSHLKASRLVTSRGTLIVASSSYITNILETMEMQKCFGAPTPITSVRSGDPKADGQLLEAEEHRILRRVVGIARFLRTLRPDIGFAVKELSHRLAVLWVRDFKCCKQLCRYLSKTRGLGVFFPKRTGKRP